MGAQSPSKQSGGRVRQALKTALHWVLYRGNRLALTAAILLVVFGSLLFLTGTDVLAVGPGSIAGTLFSSGLTSGVLTVVTLILSINQLILSRVFGSPGDLRDRLDGTKAYRARIEDLAGVHATPNDPAGFIALLGETIADRARALSADLEQTISGADEEIGETLDAVADYGQRLADALEPEASIAEVLNVLLSTDYARKMTDVHELSNRFGAELDPVQRGDLETLEQLLEDVAIARQFFKTLALQQNFARLSRIIAVTGLAAFFATVLLSLVYRSSGVTLEPRLMPLVVSAGLTIVSAPIVAVIVYVLRAATVARHTVSVGPFVPPHE